MNDEGFEDMVYRVACEALKGLEGPVLGSVPSEALRGTSWVDYLNDQVFQCLLAEVSRQARCRTNDIVRLAALDVAIHWIELQAPGTALRTAELNLGDGDYELLAFRLGIDLDTLFSLQGEEEAAILGRFRQWVRAHFERHNDSIKGIQIDAFEPGQ